MGIGSGILWERGEAMDLDDLLLTEKEMLSVDMTRFDIARAQRDRAVRGVVEWLENHLLVYQFGSYADRVEWNELHRAVGLEEE